MLKKHCFANGRILFYILLKIFDKLNEPHVKIVIRKSFVALAEQWRVPRIELMGALLSVWLFQVLVKGEHILCFYHTASGSGSICTYL